MGAMSGWVWLWILLALAVAAAGGVVLARALSPKKGAKPPQIPESDSPAVREAKDVLRQRYARGEIDRESYLQAKVELED